MTRPITCVSDPDAPALAVRPASLSFTGEQGGAAPAAKTIDVANTGGGHADLDRVRRRPWLSGRRRPSGTRRGHASPSRRDTSGLAAGTYTANVTISAPGRPARRGRPGHAHRRRRRRPAPALAVTPGSADLQRHAGRREPGRQDARGRQHRRRDAAAGRRPTTPPWLDRRPGERDRTPARSPSSPSIGGADRRDLHARRSRVTAPGARLAEDDPGHASPSTRRRSRPRSRVAPSSLSFSAIAGRRDGRDEGDQRDQHAAAARSTSPPPPTCRG